jgi:hypothetical protein
MTRNRTQDIAVKEWFNQTTMFFGLAMTHAGPQSRFERESKTEVGEPTIVGVGFYFL